MRTLWNSSKTSLTLHNGNLRRRLNLQIASLLSLFLILTVASYWATQATIRAKEFDSAIFNRVCLQRMLVERYVGQVNRVIVGLAVGDWDVVLRHKKYVAQTAEEFLATQHALLEGGTLQLTDGKTATIPPIENEEIRRALVIVEGAWGELHRSAVMALRSDRWSLKNNQFVNKLQTQAELTVDMMNKAALLLQMESESDLRRLNLLQKVSLAVAIILFLGVLCFVSIRIVTPLDRSFAERERLQRELELILDSVGEGIYGVDAENRIYFANAHAAQLLGYSIDELNGCLQHELLHNSTNDKNSHDARDCLLQASLLQGEKHCLQEDVFRRSDGTDFEVEYSSTPIFHKGHVSGCVVAFRDITSRKEMERSFAKANEQMITTSRRVGMAEIATGVLHNVGNVLNSINVSANLILEKMQSKSVDSLVKASMIISEHQSDLATFVTEDKQGKTFPRLLEKLACNISSDRDIQLSEIQSLIDNLAHVKEIVSTQQAYAQTRGSTESTDLLELIEDALRINDSALIRHRVNIVRHIDEIPPIVTERHKVMQILVNLISNAKNALSDSDQEEKTMILSVSKDEEGVRIEVRDNGMGIRQEHMTKIFTHGFTTRSNGHGFGLHSSALAAQEVGGSLSASSDGPDRGATFTLRLPLENEALCKV